MKKKTKKPLYTERKTGCFARFFKFLVRLLFGKFKYIYHDEEPTEPSVLISNHTYFLAPLIMQYQYPKNVRTWGNNVLFKKESAKEFLLTELCIDKSFKSKILSCLIHILSPLVAWVYTKQLNGIPVYYDDLNAYKTFKISSETLSNGSNVAIYPENTKTARATYNGVISEFSTGFTYIGKIHYRATGKCVKYYPIYAAQDFKEIHFGKPIAYDPEIPMNEQAEIIVKHLFDEIMRLNSLLPEHWAVPIFAAKRPKKKKCSKKPNDQQPKESNSQDTQIADGQQVKETDVQKSKTTNGQQAQADDQQVEETADQLLEETSEQQANETKDQVAKTSNDQNSTE
ncbi:MAG TPA: hypothetical protein PKX91_06290 [Clostridia bacterium]|nr:hypothetical protein [Clostridia bacterium]